MLVINNRCAALERHMDRCMDFYIIAIIYLLAMLTELNLQKFDTVIDKCRGSFQRQIHACENGIIQHFVYLHLM